MLLESIECSAVPYTVAFEVMKGRIQSAHKESASGALKMIDDIKLTGMKLMSIKNSSGYEVLITELEKIAGETRPDHTKETPAAAAP
jgi:hypothetical protein